MRGGGQRNDMRNLMSSTEIGTIVVDRALRVKLFTPRIPDVFNSSRQTSAVR